MIAGAIPGQTTSDVAAGSPLSKISISDVDFDQTETVTVTLSNPANGTLSNTGGGSYDSKTGVYSVTGTDATVSTAVDGLVFTPTPHQVVPGGAVVTTFTIHATDTAGGIITNSATTVTATAVNDDPVISSVVSSQRNPEAATVAPLSKVTISDADFGQTETVTVTLSNPANGALPNFAIGSYDSSSGVYTVTGADAVVSTALDGLVFTPTAHQVAPGGSVATNFTIKATHTAGDSSSDGNTTVTTTAVNNAPQIGGTITGQTVNDNATDQPFAGVTIGDPDFGASVVLTITVTSDGSPSDANGTLAGTGLSKVTTGTYTLAADNPTAVTAALDALLFTPTAHEIAPGGTVTTGITLSAADGIAVSPTANTATSVVTTAINTPPAIIGAVANQGVPYQLPTHPFATVSVVDPDFGAIETATVSLSATGKGTLSNLSGGSYNAATEIYSVIGRFLPTPPHCRRWYSPQSHNQMSM